MIVVYGTMRTGKTTLAQKIATDNGLPLSPELRSSTDLVEFFKTGGVSEIHSTSAHDAWALIKKLFAISNPGTHLHLTTNFVFVEAPLMFRKDN